MKWEWANVIGVTIIGVLILIVILQNTEAVETRIVFVSVTTPRVVLLAVSLLVGFWLGVIVTNRTKARKESGEGDHR